MGLRLRLGSCFLKPVTTLLIHYDENFLKVLGSSPTSSEIKKQTPSNHPLHVAGPAKGVVPPAELAKGPPVGGTPRARLRLAGTG